MADIKNFDVSAALEEINKRLDLAEV